MQATAEIDNAGRLVLPKEMRDALHLVPGTRIRLDQDGDTIVLRPQEHSGHLVKIKGFWVHDADDTGPLDVLALIDQDRETRMRHVLGLEDDLADRMPE